MPLPGDDLVPSPMVQTIHAVTINAPPHLVCPWLAQTGQGRAGFYADSRFWDRCVDWYYRRLSRRQPGEARAGLSRRRRRPDRCRLTESAGGRHRRGRANRDGL